MGVSIEHHNAERERERREAQDQKAHKIERGLLIAYAVSLVGAAVATYTCA
jgi:hypothetical protein